MEDLLKAAIGPLTGIVAIYFVHWGVAKARDTETGGRLYYGGLMAGSVVFCLAGGLAFLIGALYVDHLLFKALILGVAISLFLIGIYSWFEYRWTEGFINSDGIGFQSIWYGRRFQEWGRLMEVKFNRYMYWYLLTFETGKPIRISVYLKGHGALLKKLRELGYDF